MRHLILPLLALMSLASGLTSCEECGPSAEPLLHLSLSWTTPGKVDTLYALNSQNPLPTQPYSTTGLTTSNRFELPLNLNADSSRYVFLQNGHRDTLTVYYKRNYAYRNTKCGYVLDLTPPAGQQAQVTRGTVQSISYLKNNYQRTFFSRATETEIYLSVRL